MGIVGRELYLDGRERIVKEGRAIDGVVVTPWRPPHKAGACYQLRSASLFSLHHRFSPQRDTNTRAQQSGVFQGEG